MSDATPSVPAARASSRSASRAIAIAIALAAVCSPSARAHDVDLAAIPSEYGTVKRIYGSVGNGGAGVPVAGGGDLDGDGLGDYALAAMLADAPGRPLAGQVFVVFGDGTTRGDLDTAEPDPRILRILGEAEREATGSEVWIDDVTGDGLADLLICRQNHSPAADRIGAGALTLVPGGGHLAALAERLEPLDLAAPDPGVAMLHVLGSEALGRLCVWARTGDVTGDGVADIVVGSDQLAAGGVHRGGGILIRGGAHLAAAAAGGGAVADLAEASPASLDGHLIRFTPPPIDHGHLGATCQIGDLDGNGRGEVLLASALNRAGAALLPAGAPPGAAHGTGGTPHGTLYILWDDNFPSGLWPPGATIAVDSPPGSRTVLAGGDDNRDFGEELLAGRDYDGDGELDLFVGDLTGDGTPGRNRGFSGIAHVFFSAAGLKGRMSDVDALTEDDRRTRFLGPDRLAIAGDTAFHGDFDGDGRTDLAFSSPHGNPEGRFSAGVVHVVRGGSVWPAEVDLADEPPPGLLLTEILGAFGTESSDQGDTLAYSATGADVDGDGRTDLLINEMLGNGAGEGSVDVGNLIVLNGAGLPSTSESCEATVTSLCLAGNRFHVSALWQAPTSGPFQAGPATAVTLSSDSGLFWFFRATNIELLVKVLDACVPASDRYWFFATGLTNVGVTLRVEDSQAGVVRLYSSPLGTPFPPILDTGAFATCP